MRSLFLLAMAGFAWLALVVLGRAPLTSGMAAASSTSPAAAAAPAVHATTDDDLALLRVARPGWNGALLGEPHLGGLRMRWCVAQDRCRSGDGRR